MTLTRKLLTLSSIAALSFCFAACDDDSSESNPTPSTSCTAAQNTCKSETVASQCDATLGEMKDVTCNENEKCISGVCLKQSNNDPTQITCTAGDHICEGQQLMKCKDDGTGYEIVQDCEGSTPKCNAENKACEAECESDYKVCLSDKAREYCDNGAIKREDCAAGTTCDATAKECKAECEDSFVAVCDGDRIKKCVGGKFEYKNCGADQKCDIETVECVDNNIEVKKDSVIGTPCKCEGNDCTFRITGKEIKAALNTQNIKLATFMPDKCTGLAALGCGIADVAIQGIVSNYIAKIKDDAYVEGPNFFSAASQAACGNVTAPEGMVVGCLRDTTIDFSHLNLTNEKGDGLLDEIKPTLDKVLGIDLSTIDPNLDLNEKLAGIGGKDGLLKIMEAVKEYANEGIKFSSANGYCLAADIEIKLNVTDNMINSIITMSKVDPMLAHINTTGTDHSKAKNATCPEGSTLLWYDVQSGGGAEDKGEAKVGFDMCLKVCEKDDDCKREGVDDGDAYKCVELPYGTAEDVAAKSKLAHVCFDNSNMTYFEGITKKFEGLIPSDNGTENAGN